MALRHKAHALRHHEVEDWTACDYEHIRYVYPRNAERGLSCAFGAHAAMLDGGMGDMFDVLFTHYGQM